MGTRNVTIVKQNGKEFVRQYGQWDGYPTGALASIVEFLKTDGAIEKLKQNLPKVELVSESCSIYPKEFDEICSAYYRIGYTQNIKEKRDALAVATGFDEDAIFKYLLSTRDTGYQILDVLILDEADAADKIVLQKAYTDKVDWQIEAVNVVDLDRECIRSYWHDNMREYNFDVLPNETEIEEFEKGGY
jgi:hypothetical protein